MQVVLKNHWFGPDASLYLKTVNPHLGITTYIPDEYVEFLPNDAEVKEGPLPEVVAAPEFNVRDLDLARESGDREAAIIAEVDNVISERAKKRAEIMNKLPALKVK